jgi:hypothetical protein
LGTMAKKLEKFTISINHYICPIFHVENNLSKLQFNFAHFIGPILTLRGPAPLWHIKTFNMKYGLLTHFAWITTTWSIFQLSGGNLKRICLIVYSRLDNFFSNPARTLQGSSVLTRNKNLIDRRI